jgi:hypothetical protein
MLIAKQILQHYNYHLHIRVVYICLALACLFSSCNPFDTKSKAKQTQWKTYVKKGAFTFEYPDYMERDSLLSPEATVAFSNKAKEMYLIIIHETRDTFRRLGYDSVNLDTYIQLVEANMDTSLVLKMLSRKHAKVNKLNAIEMMIENDLTRENKGVPVISLLKKMMIEGEKGFFQIYVWCLKEDFEKNKKDFDKIISSFREL